MTDNTVKRGYVLVYNHPQRPGVKAVSAVCSRTDAEGLRKRVGGTIVDAAGLKFRIAQKTIRVVIDPNEAVARARSLNA